MLHLYWAFRAVCFKILFLANFLTLSRLWSKLAGSGPTKTSISKKKQKNPADFDKIWSFDVKLMQDKVGALNFVLISATVLELFWKTRRGPILPPTKRGAG